MSAYGCFCDPGLPRPTADRGRGLRETVVTRPRKTYRNLGRKTVNKVAETTINPAVSELYEYIKTQCGLHASLPYVTQYRSSER
ncbi:MAG: hypothetical protein QW080_03545 [Sulfolobales archaeon]